MEFSNTILYKRLISKIPPQMHFLLSAGFLRFLVVGTINTLLDLIIFNLVIFFLIFTSFETELVVAKTAGFLIASINSYILNARFTFQKGLHNGDSKKKVIKNFGLFVIVSIIGICINVAVMFVLYRIFVFSLPLDGVVLANIATLGATGVSLIWNFLAYRKFVFK